MTTNTTTTALTPRQEAFALAVASGKSQAEAYRTAYPKSQAWKDTAVWQQASRLMAVPHVAARVASHRTELAQRSLWAREDSVRSLMEVLRPADQSCRSHQPLSSTHLWRSRWKSARALSRSAHQ
jgi:hypothetical protein